MFTIWKLSMNDTTVEQNFILPAGAHFCRVITQRNRPVLYFMVDTSAPLEERAFVIVPTGADIRKTCFPKAPPMDPDPQKREPLNISYLGTTLWDNDATAGHIFEIPDRRRLVIVGPPPGDPNRN